MVDSQCRNFTGKLSVCTRPVTQKCYMSEVKVASPYVNICVIIDKVARAKK